MKLLHVYLAGPEVFLKNAKEVCRQKKALCHKYGFEGIFPIDIELNLRNKKPREAGLCISALNEGLIKNCDIVIANITPFRGPSADAGTIFELGFAHALGKHVFAYTNKAASFTERTLEALGNQVYRGSDGKLWDDEGMFVEETGLADNLMIDGCLDANSKILIVEQAPKGQLYTYLNGFEKCLQAAKQLINK